MPESVIYLAMYIHCKLKFVLFPGFATTSSIKNVIFINLSGSVDSFWNWLHA
jgi:hypothetical protein